MPEPSEQTLYTQNNMLTPVKAEPLGPKERSCCICLQAFGSAFSNQVGSEAPVKLPCGHIFGEVCISSWTLTHNSCPLCRQPVFGFGIGDQAVNQDSTLGVSTHLGSVYSPEDDIWLDDYIWNDVDSFSFSMDLVDIDTLINCDNPNSPNVDLGYQPHRSPAISTCGEHHSFGSYAEDQRTRNAVLPLERLTTPVSAQPRQMDIDNLDLAGLGSQFAELEFRYRNWMEEFLNEPDFDAKT